MEKGAGTAHRKGASTSPVLVIVKVTLERERERVGRSVLEKGCVRVRECQGVCMCVRVLGWERVHG